MFSKAVLALALTVLSIGRPAVAAPANGFRTDDPATTEQLFKEIAAAFLEDKTVVEGQQIRLMELGENDLVDITTDAARLHMRRTVERLMDEDSRALAAE